MLPITRHYPIFANIPGLVYGVFGRRGGVSEAPFDSLNVSFSSGDNRNDVFENIRRIREALGIEESHLVCVSLVHGTDIVEYGRQDAGDVALSRAGWRGIKTGDGIIISEPGIFGIVGSADCATVLVVCPTTRVVGIFHAGWKGIVGKIVEKGIRLMTAKFGVQEHDLKVVVTPSIGPCCYRLADPAQGRMPEWTKYLSPVESGILAIDLQSALFDQLIAAGLEPKQIEFDRTCTACSTDEFFSSFVERPKTGRHATIIGFKTEEIV